MIPRPDLIATGAPEGVEVFQLTTGDVPACHVYMEAQIFTPDSKRLVVHESATPHGSDHHDPLHRYLLCDLERNGELFPLTQETGVTGPAISPDGRYFYYLVNETEMGGGRLTLKRVKLDGSDRTTLTVIDSPLPGGDNLRPSSIYPLSTIRSDGRKLVTSCFLGDGKNPAAPFGILVFDLEDGTAETIIQDGTWANLHPQYCRSTDPEEMHDLLLQHNHGFPRDICGKTIGPGDASMIDIHVLRDDGSNLRDMPWGRDGIERCQGHQCWRGRTPWAITSTNTVTDHWEGQLIESLPVPHAGHQGTATPGGIRNHLSRSFEMPKFFHFSTDIAGARLVTDYMTSDQNWRGLFMGRLGRPGVDAMSDWVPLATFCHKNRSETHVHPFLSPDGTMAFFNAVDTGKLQAYMVRGLPA